MATRGCTSPLNIIRPRRRKKPPLSPHERSHCSHPRSGLVSNSLLYLIWVYPLSEMVLYHGVGSGMVAFTLSVALCARSCCPIIRIAQKVVSRRNTLVTNFWRGKRNRPIQLILLGLRHPYVMAMLCADGFRVFLRFPVLRGG